MSDSAFQWSLTAATFVIGLFVIVAIILGLLWPVWAVLLGIIIEIAVAVPLLYFWGKNYTGRG